VPTWLVLMAGANVGDRMAQRYAWHFTRAK
jgi:hypothetical protein